MLAANEKLWINVVGPNNINVCIANVNCHRYSSYTIRDVINLPDELILMWLDCKIQALLSIKKGEVYTYTLIY